MKDKNIDINGLQFRMSFIKFGTLVHYLPHNEVKKYLGCDFEFDVDSATNLPIKLHTWIGKDHNYQEKFHKEFEVPEHLKLPLFNNNIR